MAVVMGEAVCVLRLVAGIVAVCVLRFVAVSVLGFVAVSGICVLLPAVDCAVREWSMQLHEMVFNL